MAPTSPHHVQAEEEKWQITNEVGLMLVFVLLKLSSGGGGPVQVAPHSLYTSATRSPLLELYSVIAGQKYKTVIVLISTHTVTVLVHLCVHTYTKTYIR